MTLKRCLGCGTDVVLSATACPKCGIPMKPIEEKPSLAKLNVNLPGALIVGGILMLLLAPAFLMPLSAGILGVGAIILVVRVIMYSGRRVA